MQEHEPDVGRHAVLPAQLAQYVLPGRKHRVFDGLDRAVAAEIRLEIDRPVLGKIDLAALAMGSEEFSRMVAAGDRHRVEAKGEEAIDRRAHAALGDIPGIGVDGFVAHRMLSRTRAVKIGGSPHAPTIAGRHASRQRRTGSVRCMCRRGGGSRHRHARRRESDRLQANSERALMSGRKWRLLLPGASGPRLEVQTPRT